MHGWSHCIDRREVVLRGHAPQWYIAHCFLLEGLGVCLPGELIDADSANLSGYFENRSLLMLRSGCFRIWVIGGLQSVPVAVCLLRWFATGLCDYVDWLTNHLDELFIGGHGQIA